MNNRPDASEHPDYFNTYLNRVPERDLISTLRTQINDTISLLGSLSDEQALFRYAESKWSIKEVVGHIADTERVMSYRALRVARGDRTPLPGFDENVFMKGSSFDRIPLREIIEDLVNVRQATVSLFQNLPQEAWLRKGIVNERETSARAFGYFIAGHELHHRAVLQERYLKLLS